MKLDVWIYIVSQSSYLKILTGSGDIVGSWGRGNLKSWKTLRVEGSGRNLVGKIVTSPRYVIDMTGTDPLSLGELGRGRVNSEKLVKGSIFNLRRGYWILMKFHI